MQLTALQIHHRPRGPESKPERFVLALDHAGKVIGRLDTSDTWEMRLDCLDQLCRVAGLGYEMKVFDSVDEVLADSPNLVEPRLEFEVDHPIQEDLREWAMGIAYGGTIAIGLLSAGGSALAFFSPIGIWYRLSVVVGFVVLDALTLWSLSKRRMRRSIAAAKRKSKLMTRHKSFGS